MQRLPIDDVLDEVVAALRGHAAVVLVAPPGAGKTTRVPPAILAAGLLPAASPRVVVLQPRRVAARAVAERIAEEQGWSVGGEVGYHVRFERRLGRDTRLRVVTEGILLRQLLDDPLLEGVGCVVLDEFHERSLHTDLAAALLKEVQAARPELKLVVMSATLEAEPVARYLGDCPIVRSEGRTFPVAIEHRAETGAPLEDRVADAARDVLDAGDNGDVLVFLPGAQEIRQAMGAVRRVAPPEVAVLPLHGSLPFSEQLRAIRPGPQRRVICATNIAETSLTIEGVTAVVDSGLSRQAWYDPQRGLDRLEVRPISQASAAQRAGRAGRVRPGRCVRLFSEKAFHALPAFEPAEVHRVDLAQPVLSLHGWGRRDPRGFDWYEPPAEARVTAAERLLAMLGALDGEGRLTEMGRRMLGLPVHPRLARLLVASADAGVVDAGATLAALLSERDIVLPPVRRGPGRAAPTTQGDSDLLLRMDRLQWVERQRFGEHVRDAGLDPVAARQAVRVRDELRRIVDGGSHGNEAAADQDTLLKLPLIAYPDRVCRRRAADPATATMASGGGMRLLTGSIVREGELFLALDPRRDERSGRHGRPEAVVTIASRIDEAWLSELFPDAVREERAAVYDAGRERVLGKLRVWYRDLLLRESDTGSVDPAAAEKALREALLPRAEELVEREPGVAALLRRARFLQHVAPGDFEATFVRLDPAALVSEACVGATSSHEVVGNLRHVAEAALPFGARRWLDEQAPETIAVPSGSRVRLDWSAAAVAPEVRGPVLAVRLQELFGLTRTPRVAAGRAPVVLHLLGPNFRPVQVTTDLESFWATTYPQVRKDLRVRYPRHAWPDDPLTAAPEAKGGRRR